MHLKAGEVVAYVDRAMNLDARARVEEHLADCEECRLEVAEVARVIGTAPGLRRLRIPVALAAAAVLGLLLVPSLDLPTRVSPDQHREPAVTTAAQPVAITPRGEIAVAARELVWTAVPHAARYRVVLIGGDGTALWRAETADTVALLPDSVRLIAGAPYFWKVEAETGLDRWVGSELTDFTIRGRRP